MSGVSGLAASIRAASESETFDLAGQSVSTITNTVRAAFADPLPLADMVRFTFVTGAGKLGRQKYDEGAAKAVTSTLRELGFEEDRGASCVVECGGSFKLQHDTGKNLKTVVVFPNIDGPAAVQNGMNNLSVDDGNPPSLLEEGSPEQLIAMSSKNVFQRMVSSKCPSWSQKKGMMGALEELKKIVVDLDAKLLSGTPLSDSEQDFYDSVSVSVLDDKEAFVKKAMHDQVEEANLTLAEKNTLVKQAKERLATVEKEIKESTGKPKKLEKLEGMKEKVQKRVAMLEKVEPKPPHKLKHAGEIGKLRKEMAPLQHMEDAAKGRLLSLKETQTLARKEEIEEEIAALEEASRGWFEDDDAFAARVLEAKRAFQATQSKKTKKTAGGAPAKKTAGKFVTPSANKFVTPGSMKKGAWGGAATKKKPKPKGGGVFAAMMMDSDSDSD